MKRFHLILKLLAAALAIAGIVYVLKSEHAIVAHPKGVIARGEHELIVTNLLLMLLIIVPTFIVIGYVVWRYQHQHTHSKSKANYDPDHSIGLGGEVILWIIPAIIVVFLVAVTWKATHALDPYKPIESDVKPINIQVVAIDWKWLFIYPEQGIAAVNYVQFPAKTPIQFRLAADNSPMNSFWIPQLSGQIYSMTGMITPLHMMADGPGVYSGKAAEINGAGYSSMTFIAEATSHEAFERWVESVKKSPLQLTDPVYLELLKTSENNPITFYSHVEDNLFNKIVMKYMHPQE